MITKKIYSIIAILLALSITACDITREPFQDLSDDKVFADELGIEAAALGTYALLKKNEFMRPYHFHGEFGGDNIALSGSTTDPLFYMYNYQHIPTNGHLNSLWSTCYQGIVNANKVIANAEEGTPRMNHVIGEMYYLRSFFYLNLVTIWGRPYNQDPDGNMGVPIILDAEPDVDNLPGRASVKEVYDQILSDLETAADLMSEFKRVDSEYPIYASEQAANALLSRVYLYMEENVKAAEYATKVIDSGNFSLLTGSAYETFPTMVPEDNPEVIFACRALKDEDDYGWYAFGGMYATIDGVGWGEMYASEPYRDLLDKNPEDRRHKFIEPQYVDDGTYELTYSYDKATPVGSRMFQMYAVTDNAGTWEYEYNGGTHAVMTEEVNGVMKYYITEGDHISGKTYVRINMKMKVRNGYPKYFVIKCSNQEGQPQLFSPIISRLAEMYLNRAEVNAKANKVTEALADVNVIRERAGIPTYTEVPDGMTILEVVLEERRLELAYEAHRRYDIFRNGLTLDRKYPGTHDKGSNALLTVPANHPRVVDYIPEAQILAMPNLIQNP
ncbi:RagB/SusD family nutrient uptake outer membrane protein [Carboxylicivirga mesophila]|uniref:RagB/SusD family nutrient uptake outer membrane protein n=1 Tax=Carboxylicivirga mesophila TaxID=1166478 RepID=A0ABS5K7Z2_9BACT|nr:RagB/SusD family nutrient uptake outer membrane protein [Carboxylicivirga mesophila]MBS2211119.1 RagB/SusD family nutrient uptake outer membrane protein [Carboxylicivirga mesophila]